MEEKTKVSEVPQDMKVWSVLKDAPKKVELPSETKVCLTRHGKISKPKCHGNKSLACRDQPMDTLTTSSGPILASRTQPL